MRDQTTADLRRYVAKGRVNMPADAPPKPVVVPAMVYPMCERCGVRDIDVCDARVGLFRVVKALCTTCRQAVRDE
jgi:hypothetical protein